MTTSPRPAPPGRPGTLAADFAFSALNGAYARGLYCDCPPGAGWRRDERCHNNASQVPGGTSAYAGHYDAHIYYSGAWNDAWLTTDNDGVSFQGVDPSSGNTAYYNGKQFYIWDTQCST